MQYLQFTDFRNHSKAYFDKIAEGESFIIIKKGKPIAKIIPFEEPRQGWKRTHEKVILKNTSKTTLDFIVQERKEV